MSVSQPQRNRHTTSDVRGRVNNEREGLERRPLCVGDGDHGPDHDFPVVLILDVEVRGVVHTVVVSRRVIGRY